MEPLDKFPRAPGPLFKAAARPSAVASGSLCSSVEQQEELENEYGENKRRHGNLLQGLGTPGRAADRLPSRLAAQRRRLGHADALLLEAGLSRDRSRPPRPWPFKP